jgi:hypothetical protein
LICWRKGTFCRTLQNGCYAGDPTNDASFEGDPYVPLFDARIVSAWRYPFIIFVQAILSIIFYVTK